MVNNLYLCFVILIKGESKMKIRVNKAAERGEANHGWLHAKYSFSFASFNDPKRIHFGALRVLNDDIVAPGMGFSTHPHDNMEIITIPLRGALRHKDSMGNTSTIQAGEIQVMSAGSGVEHSEFNPNHHEDLNLFQIWLFPNKRNVAPRYDQKKIRVDEFPNTMVEILTPNPTEDAVWIHQDAWFSMGTFTEDTAIDYTLKNPANGVYIMQIEGMANVEGEQLNERDAIQIESVSAIKFNANKGARILLMEVPLVF